MVFLVTRINPSRQITTGFQWLILKNKDSSAGMSWYFSDNAHSFKSFSFSSMHNGNDGSSLMLTELDWNLAEDWWISFAGSYSIGRRKRGKSEFGAASDLFSLSLRHYR